MIGLVYNNWKVLEHSHTKGKIAYYKCICLLCNEEHVVDGRNIRSGASKCCQKCAGNKPGQKREYKERGAYESKYTVEEARYRYLYTRNKKDAKRRGIEFSLTFEEHRKLVAGNCTYCGIEPSTTVNVFKGDKLSKEKEAQGFLTYNGIDRLDSTKGYETSNVQTCCEYCNKAKLARSEEEFLIWIKRAHNFNN